MSQTREGHEKAASEPLDHNLKLRQWDNTHKTVVERYQIEEIVSVLDDGQGDAIEDGEVELLRGLLDGSTVIRTELTQEQKEMVDAEFRLDVGEGTPLSWKLYALAGLWGIPIEAISAYIGDRAAAERRQRKESGRKKVDICNF